MDSEEPPNVRVACSGDIDEVVRLMHDAAAWMSAKGTPAWDVARIDRTFAETFVLRSELLVASCSDGIAFGDLRGRLRQHGVVVVAFYGDGGVVLDLKRGMSNSQLHEPKGSA